MRHKFNYHWDYYKGHGCALIGGSENKYCAMNMQTMPRVIIALTNGETNKIIHDIVYTLYLLPPVRNVS